MSGAEHCWGWDVDRGAPVFVVLGGILYIRYWYLSLCYCYLHLLQKTSQLLVMNT